MPLSNVIPLKSTAHIFHCIDGCREAENGDSLGIAERAEEILSVSRVVNAHPVLITEKRIAYMGNVPCDSADYLAGRRSPMDLVASI